MDADLDTLATALYVTCDDLLREHPDRAPLRIKTGTPPRITDAELITIAVMQAMLQFTSEARWLRYAHKHLTGMFPYLPEQSGYNKRLRKLAGTISWINSMLAARTSIATDDVWLADSTPVECGRSRETALRSDLAGWAEYGYCASHSRYFWGLRLHLITTVHGLILGWALTGAKADERAVFCDLITGTALLAAPRDRRQTAITDKGYHSRQFEAELAAAGIDQLRPTRKGEQPRPGQEFFKPLRQIIESVNDTLKGQLDLERHGGRTMDGVCTRVGQRILALTAAIWHNDRIGAPILRSLTAYDH